MPDLIFAITVMEKRKVWHLFSALRPEEVEQFGRWLESELYEKQYYLRRMKDCLTRSYPEAPTDQEMWSFLYPEKSYDDGRLRKLAGDLHSMLEEFLAIEAFRYDKDQKELVLLQELNRRGKSDLFIKRIHKIERELFSRKHRNAEFYRTLFELETEKLRFEIIHRKTFPEIKNENPLFGENISQRQKLNYAFDSWWVHEKMSLAIINSNVSRISGLTIESVLLKELLENLTSFSPFHYQPWLIILHDLHQLINGQEAVDLKNLLQLVRQDQDQIPYDDLLMFFSIALNYYIFKLNKSGDRQAAYQIFTLYEWAIGEKLIFASNFLPSVHFKNIVTICLRIEDYDRAWKYLHDFRRLLAPDVADEIGSLMLAQYYIHKNKPADVIKTLSNKKFANVNDEINARSFLLEAYYENDHSDTDWLYDQADQLIRYIRRKDELDRNGKIPYLNRFKLFKRMLNAYTREDLENVGKAIEKADPIDRPDWLLQKISVRLSELQDQG